MDSFFYVKKKKQISMAFTFNFYILTFYLFQTFPLGALILYFWIILDDSSIMTSHYFFQMARFFQHCCLEVCVNFFSHNFFTHK